MRSQKGRRDLRRFCAQVQADDGVDPRDMVSRHEPSRFKQERKARQLCKQVLQTLSVTLSGQCGDPVLRDLYVAGVEPAPDAGHLLVTVQLTTLEGQVTAEEVLNRCAYVRGFLRSEVAAAITRKRAPDLIFRVRAYGEVEP